MSRVRFGILGTANIARRALAPALQRCKNAELVAVASRSEEKARSFAAECGIPRAHSSYQALLDDPEVDAVYIPLPNSLHLEWSIKAAQAKKHVLCEKPLALSEAQCLEMAAAAGEQGVKLMEAFMYRFHPRSIEVLARVREGAIGRLALIQASFSFALRSRENIRLQPELGGGSLMDVGCYCVNLARTLAGQEPSGVQAQADWGASGVDERLVGTLVFPSGAYAQFDSSLVLPRRERYQVLGSEGEIAVDKAFLPGEADATYLQTKAGETQLHTVSGVDEYQLMAEHFAQCVLEDKPVRYPPEEAAANLRVIEALYRSARSGGRLEAV